MVEKEVFLTKEGLLKLEEELEELKTIKRKEIADKIKVARGFGDLSENAEYDEAKNEQASIEERIAKIENMLVNAVTIDESEITTDKVSVGSKIIIRDLEDDEDLEYLIVGSAEADPLEGKISNESPVGRAAIGKRKGDILQVETPVGVVEYRIVKIAR